MARIYGKPLKQALLVTSDSFPLQTTRDVQTAGNRSCSRGAAPNRPWSEPDPGSPPDHRWGLLFLKALKATRLCDSLLRPPALWCAYLSGYLKWPKTGVRPVSLGF